MSVPFLPISSSPPVIPTGLSTLDKDMAEVLLRYVFGPDYLQVVLVEVGATGLDVADLEASQAKTLYVPMDAGGPEGWLVATFPSAPETDGTTVMIDVEYYDEVLTRLCEEDGGPSLFTNEKNPIKIPSEADLGLLPLPSDRYVNPTTGLPVVEYRRRREYERWRAWAQRLKLDQEHQKRAGILTRMPAFHKIVRTVVLRLPPAA